MNQSVALDKLDEVLTNSSKLAASLGYAFLVYLIDMAVLHVRKKAIHLEANVEHRLQKMNFAHPVESTKCEARREYTLRA